MPITAHTYVEWRLTKATEFRFRELYHQYTQVDEDSDEAQAIVEMIKSLPGFPVQAPMESDFLFIRTDTPFN